jgi:hypothetical protein
MRAMTQVLKILFTSCVIFIGVNHVQAQVGVGVVYGFDLYQYNRNPTTIPDTIQHGLGSALFNMSIGPKLWIGLRNVSISVEGQIGISPFALDINEYKGLGAFYFPLMASINYGGLSGFQDVGRWGFGLAGGFQLIRTDLYFLKDEFESIDRSVFQTTFGQVNVGFGSKATAVYLYARYGQGDADAYHWHVGIMLDQNISQRKKMQKTELQ